MASDEPAFAVPVAARGADAEEATEPITVGVPEVPGFPGVPGVPGWPGVPGVPG